ncbi:MAG TPA: hypothetical protein PLU35_10265 [Phycisphaerales bacterium]|nr:hypothetical protein [Phycisphaerales bacterium]
MADKRIVIDNDAFERLCGVRKDSESLSDTIRRVVPESFDVEAWLRRVRRARLSPKAIAAVEDQVRSRRRRSQRER